MIAPSYASRLHPIGGSCAGSVGSDVERSLKRFNRNQNSFGVNSDGGHRAVSTLKESHGFSEGGIKGCDDQLPSQQNLSQFGLAVVIMRAKTKALADLLELMPELAQFELRDRERIPYEEEAS